MKKIINGKKYDTDTAKEVGSHWNGTDPRDFSWYQETLYEKRTGEFFLYGEGGPMTRYAVSCGQNEWSGSARIIPLDHEAARKWAEKHLSADEYESFFGTVEEDETKRIVTYSLPVSTVEKIKRAASSQGISLSEAVAAAIDKCY